MTSSTQIEALCTAADSLSLASRFDDALALLAACDLPAGDDDRLRVLLRRAEVEQRRDRVRGRPDAADPDVLDEAAELAAHDGVDAGLSWDVEFLALRRRYDDMLARPGGGAWFGPDGRDPAAIADVVGEAERLAACAPDRRRLGWILQCRGWIADNIVADREAAPTSYAAALTIARDVGDDLLLFEAQRHLGDHAHDDGEHAAALAAWSESSEAAARAGYLTGVLSQQVLLAVLTRDTGDVAGANAVSAEVARWAGAVGARQVARQAEGLLAGIDPTRPPES